MPARVNRLQPALAAQHMQTFSIRSPIDTHTRPATCAEVECSAWSSGWVTRCDPSTDLGARQIAYLRSTGVPTSVPASAAVRLQGARRYTEGTEGALVTFTFPAGTRCFTEHRVPVERPELFIVRDGDWRGNPRGTAPRQHSKPEHWVEEFADHQAAVQAAVEKG